MKRRFLITILLLSVLLPLAAQKPRVTVIPFNSIGISKSDAQGLTLLFETALHNTDAFTLIEQMEAESILKAQEYSLGDCVDEQCAIEIGRLLSADQIVLGTVGRVADIYYLAVKIIDVQTGQNLISKKEQVQKLSELVGKIDTIALQLAGEQYDESTLSKIVHLDLPEGRMEEQKEAIVTARLDRHYFSIGAGAALTIPVGDVGGIMMLAFYPEAFFNFNLSYYWGVISFGILVGINIDSTREEVTYQYNLLSIPFGVSAKYSTNFNFPIYGFIEIAGGLAINIVTFKEVYENMSDVAAAKVFLLPTIGGGFFLKPELSVSLHASFLMIFFDNSAYIGIAPGLKIEFNF